MIDAANTAPDSEAKAAREMLTEFDNDIRGAFVAITPLVVTSHGAPTEEGQFAPGCMSECPLTVDMTRKGRSCPQRSVDVETDFSTREIVASIAEESRIEKLDQFKENTGMRIGEIVTQIILQTSADCR